MSINRGMHKEDVVHIYNGILFNHKVEQNCAICRCRWTQRQSYRVRSVRKRKKQTLYYNIVSVWNPEKMVQMNLCTKGTETQMQRTNLWITHGKGGGMNWETRIDVCVCVWVWVCSHEYSVEYDSWQLHGLQPARLLYPWNFPGKNTAVGCHFLLQWIFQNQIINPVVSCIAGRLFITEPLMRTYWVAQGALFNAL